MAHAPPVTASKPPVEACKQCPAVRAESVTLLNVGAAVTATLITLGLGEVNTMLLPAVSDPTGPPAQAVDVEVITPAVDVRQSPEVNAVSLRLAADNWPVKLGAFVTATPGLGPVPTNTLLPAVKPVRQVEHDTTGEAPEVTVIGAVPVIDVNDPPQVVPEDCILPEAPALKHCPEVRAAE